MILRYAGGRTSRLSKEMQELGFRAGINGMLSGDYLTTKGADAAEDLEMLAEMDLKIVLAKYKKTCIIYTM